MIDQSHESYRALVAACDAVQLDASGAEPIRLAANAIWRLPGSVVARIAKAGQEEQTLREVRLARWLTELGLPVVRPHPGVDTPLVVSGRPVSFWDELPDHVNGSILDLASLLRQLHALPVPDFPIGRLDPFVRVSRRIEAARTLSQDDRGWLLGLLADLEASWQELPAGLPECVVHGDAWVGNVARLVSEDRAIFMDLERCSLGRPEWNLVSTAVKLTSTGAVSATEYQEFCEGHGADVLEWSGYETMRAARELRMTTYAAQHAATDPAWRDEAQYRVDCLRGRSGPRPWKWTGIM